MPKNCQLTNNIANDIYLELAANGPKWHGFNIDYQQSGNIPFSKSNATNWSAWNIKDKSGNYYGTITLHSNGQTMIYAEEYIHGDKGLSVEGINFSYDPNSLNYTLNVTKVNRIKNNGPFPDTAIATPATYTGTNDKITLNVSGNKIINNKGEVIQLKGFARPSLEWTRQGQMLSKQDLNNMISWGANTLRLSLNQNYWFESGPVTEKGSYKQIINALIQEANQRGCAVILDLHWVENNGQSPMANRNSIKFWQEVAEQYKDFGTVMFELFNEPVNIDKNIWLRGNNSYAGYQELYDAVRNTGAKNICIVNGLDWGYDLSFVNEQFKLNGYNVVYGSHPYNDKADLQRMRDNYKNILGKYPLIFTEFGVNSENYFPDGYQQVYANVMQIANEANINYTAWAWWVESDLKHANVFPCIISDWTGKPLNGGVNVKNDMTAFPVHPINGSRLKPQAMHHRSVEQQEVRQQIQKHIETLQTEISRRSIIYKVLNGIATFIPTIGPLSLVKKIAVWLMKQVLDIDGATANNEKIHTLQAMLTTTNAQTAIYLIQKSSGLNHERNIFKRILSQISPTSTKTRSRELAEKLASMLPAASYNPLTPIYAASNEPVSPVLEYGISQASHFGNIFSQPINSIPNFVQAEVNQHTHQYAPGQ